MKENYLSVDEKLNPSRFGISEDQIKVWQRDKAVVFFVEAQDTSKLDFTGLKEGDGIVPDDSFKREFTTAYAEGEKADAVILDSDYLTNVRDIDEFRDKFMTQLGRVKVDGKLIVPVEIEDGQQVLKVTTAVDHFPRTVHIGSYLRSNLNAFGGSLDLHEAEGGSVFLHIQLNERTHRRLEDSSMHNFISPLDMPGRFNSRQR